LGFVVLIVDLIIEDAQTSPIVNDIERNSSRQIRLVIGEIYRSHFAGEIISPSHLARVSGTSFENIRLVLREIQKGGLINVLQKGRTRHVHAKPLLIAMSQAWVLHLLKSLDIEPRDGMHGEELHRAFLALHAADVKSEDLRLNHLLRSTHGRGLCCLLFRNLKRHARDLSVNDILETLPVSHETVRLMKKDLIDMEMVTQYKGGRRTYLHPTPLLTTEVEAYIARISVYVDKNIVSLRPQALAKTV
jgi:hypothetical protein